MRQHFIFYFHVVRMVLVKFVNFFPCKLTVSYKIILEKVFKFAKMNPTGNALRCRKYRARRRVVHMVDQFIHQLQNNVNEIEAEVSYPKSKKILVEYIIITKK